MRSRGRRPGRAGEYTMTMNGRASGLVRVVASGEGTFMTHGFVKDGRPQPESYSSKSTSDEDMLDVRMTFDGGAMKELAASEPPPSKDYRDQQRRKRINDILTKARTAMA